MSPKDFAALPRYANGRLKDLPDVYGKLTPKQIDSLDSDDWSYYQELEEEANYLFLEAMKDCGHG